MLPDRVSNPGPLTYESGALPIAARPGSNPFMTGDAFGGHMQTEQIQFRRNRKRCMIGVHIVCLQEFLCKIK